MSQPTQRPSSGDLPLLPLRSMTLLPGLAQPVELGRAASVDAVKRARRRSRGEMPPNLLVVATQREALIEHPSLEDLYPIGVLAEVTQALQGVGGRMTAIVRGLERVRLLDVHGGVQHLNVQFQRAHETMGDPTLAYALSGAVQDLVKQHETLLPASARNRSRAQTMSLLLAERSPSRIGDIAATHVGLDADILIEMLHELQVSERLRKLLESLSHRLNVLQVKRDLDRHVRDHLSKHEQEAMLRHKMRAIQSELGEQDDEDRWLDELEERMLEVDLPDEARSAVDRELNRLRRMNPQSGEATIARSYLELIADLPWGPASATPDDLDLSRARKLLETEHYGLEKVKRRIIEYLSVRKLAPEKKGPILCLAGPPGVGKTSLGRSIAETLGRQFVRISLGGVRDDAEIRGHRRTYVGSLPGRLIQAMRRAGTINPVFVLDEIDKLTAPDLRGDPAGALLEALDPEQNDSFEDHYLGVGYDLSQVIFVCTANDLTRIPTVLRDRLEVIELSGYTTEEKLVIAREHLIPRAMKEHGLSARRPPGGNGHGNGSGNGHGNGHGNGDRGHHPELRITDEALELVITGYTRESGVRNLQRELEGLLRDVAMEIAEGTQPRLEIGVEDIGRVLGPPRFHEEIAEKQPTIGLVTGLGWTPSGGRLLFVEAATTPGQGNIRLTGRLGEVMRESGETALSLVRSRAKEFGVDPLFLRDRDIHIHVPAGAVPKDGPSAGITVTTAVISTLTGRPVRPDVAMTGEVTLSGKVLPIGGVREKVLAAHRAGIRDVVLPLRNAKDEPDIPEQVRKDIRLHYARRIEDVLTVALLEKVPTPVGEA